MADGRGAVQYADDLTHFFKSVTYFGTFAKLEPSIDNCCCKGESQNGMVVGLREGRCQFVLALGPEMCSYMSFWGTSATCCFFGAVVTFISIFF